MRWLEDLRRKRLANNRRSFYSHRSSRRVRNRQCRTRPEKRWEGLLCVLDCAWRTPFRVTRLQVLIQDARSRSPCRNRGQTHFLEMVCSLNLEDCRGTMQLYHLFARPQFDDEKHRWLWSLQIRGRVGWEGEMRACIFPNRTARQIATEKTKASEKKPAPQNSPPTSSCGAPVGWWKDERRTSLLAEMSIIGRQFFREARRPLPVPYSLYWYQLFHEARGAAVDSEEGGSHFSRVFFFLPLFVRRWVLSVGLFYFIILIVFVDFVVSFFSPSLFLFLLLGVGRWVIWISHCFCCS